MRAISSHRQVIVTFYRRMLAHVACNGQFEGIRQIQRGSERCAERLQAVCRLSPCFCALSTFPVFEVTGGS